MQLFSYQEGVEVHRCIDELRTYPPIDIQYQEFTNVNFNVYLDRCYNNVYRWCSYVYERGDDLMQKESSNKKNCGHDSVDLFWVLWNSRVWRGHSYLHDIVCKQLNYSWSGIHHAHMRSLRSQWSFIVARHSNLYITIDIYHKINDKGFERGNSSNYCTNYSHSHDHAPINI